MQAIINSIIKGLITAKEDEISDTKQIIEAHQKEWEKLEKEKEALEQLLAILPELDRAAFERNVTQGFNKQKPHYFASGGKLPVQEYNPAFNDADEKINVANVRNWQSKNVPPMQNPPPKKENETFTALIPKPELLKYVRTQPSLFPEEKPVHVFESEGQEYELYYTGNSSISIGVLPHLVFHNIKELRDTTGVVYVFCYDGWCYTFQLRAPKQQGTNNF